MMLCALRRSSVKRAFWRRSFWTSSSMGLRLDFRSAFLRSQGLEDSIGPLSPPIGQQRRVQTFAAEQSAQAASRRRSRFGFCKDALFIFSGVGPPLWFGNYFWVRPCTSDRFGARFGCRCTAVRLASLAFAPFRVSQTPRRKNNTKRIHTCPFLSRPAH